MSDPTASQSVTGTIKKTMFLVRPETRLNETFPSIPCALWYGDGLTRSLNSLHGRLRASNMIIISVTELTNFQPPSYDNER